MVHSYSCFHQHQLDCNMHNDFEFDVCSKLKAYVDGAASLALAVVTHMVHTQPPVVCLACPDCSKRLTSNFVWQDWSARPEVRKVAQNADAILIFMPGAPEITRLVRLLEGSPHLRQACQGQVTVLPLHGALSSQDQVNKTTLPSCTLLWFVTHCLSAACSSLALPFGECTVT